VVFINFFSIKMVFDNKYNMLEGKNTIRMSVLLIEITANSPGTHAEDTIPSRGHAISTQNGRKVSDSHYPGCLAMFT
jgi:hypothetical protein